MPRGSLEPPSHLQKTLIRSKVVLPATGCAPPPLSFPCRSTPDRRLTTEPELPLHRCLRCCCAATVKGEKGLPRIYGFHTERYTHSILTTLSPFILFSLLIGHLCSSLSLLRVPFVHRMVTNICRVTFVRLQKLNNETLSHNKHVSNLYR